MATQSIHAILAHFREEAQNNRDLGDRFERLMRRYLELDPIYSERYSARGCSTTGRKKAALIAGQMSF